MPRLRTYRALCRQEDLIHFRVVVKETDLDVGVRRERLSPDLVEWTLGLTRECRAALEAYIARHPAFLTSLEPLDLLPDAPPLALEMARAARLAGVGPMAAVAGAIAEHVGRALLRRSRDVIVENGGDIFLRSTRRRYVGVFAGDSPFSHRLALEIPPDLTPLGICTSSGTVGHSLSFGSADAVVILASSAALADAVATAAANLVRDTADLERAVNFAMGIGGVVGAVAIRGERLAARGRVKLVPA